MRKFVVATAMGLGVLVAAPSPLQAQEASPPTTIDVETSTVERTVTTRDVERVNNDDDDDSNAGLWGLLGLIGLLGLAGLAGLKRRDTDYSSGARISGDTTPRGASSTDR